MNAQAHILTPWGPVFIEASNQGVLAVRFEGALRGKTKPRQAPESDLTRAAATELCAYLSGRLRQFSVPVDLSWTTPFLRDIYSALLDVPFGCTTSYGALAALAGRFRAARAVGGAMAKNRALIFVPCHRVIASDGRMGGWSGPVGLKEKLHALENIDTPGRPLRVR